MSTVKAVMEIVLGIILISIIWMIYDIINAPAVNEEEKILPTKLHEETKSFLKEY